MSIKPLVRRDLYEEGRISLKRNLEMGEISPEEFRVAIRKLPTGVNRFVWYIDPSKQFVQPGYFIPNNSQALPATPHLITLAPNGTSGIVPIEFDEGSGTPEIFAICSVHTGPYLFRIMDAGDKYEWSNRPIHIETASGTGQRPFYLPLTYPVETYGGTRALGFIAEDISGAPNNIRFCLRGRRFLQRQASPDVQELWSLRAEHMDRSRPYFLIPDEDLLNVPEVALAPNNFMDFTLRAPSDAPLDLKKLMAVSSPAGTPFELTLAEYSSGRQFSSRDLRIHSSHMFGSGEYPGIEFESFFLPKNYRLTGRLWNLGAVPTSFYLTFSGEKIRRPDTR